MQGVEEVSMTLFFYCAMKATGHPVLSAFISQQETEFTMKFTAILIAAVLSVSSAVVFAHSGGTDSKGCHRNHKTGDYHCH
tara:strand:+ start:7910 stop:8152 length:243 start_codon:yes stop_codon:yes gene_type:complete